MSKMVTRTFIGTKVTAMTMNIESGEKGEITQIFEGKIRKENPKTYYINKLRKEHETDELKVVTITDIKQIAELRGMTTEDFYNASVVLPEEQVKREEAKQKRQ